MVRNSKRRKQEKGRGKKRGDKKQKWKVEG
jgi:hypothetical protein